MSWKGCEAAKALAVKIQQALAGPAPTGGKPQRPLLYGPNDPDTDAVGTCLDFSVDDGNCVPYQPFTLSVTIDVAPQYTPARYGADPTLYSNVQTVTVSGKQAKSFTDTVHGAKAGEPAYDEYDVYVSPYNDITRPGMIAGIAKADRPRGAADSAKPDISRLHDLDKVLAKIIAKYVP